MDAPSHSEVWRSLKDAALQQQKLMNAQMYPEVRRDARNQILADLLVQFATEERRTYFNMDRDGYTRLDGTLMLTPEQMAALEDAILEHKAKED